MQDEAASGNINVTRFYDSLEFGVMLRYFSMLSLALLFTAHAWADEPGKAEPKSTADLVKQLDAESFSERQAASEALTALGKEALPALAEAAQGESTEVATRALDILRKHHESGSAELKAAAKESLQKLAAGEGTVARRAGEVLNPKPMPATPAVPPRIGLRPGIRIEPGMRIAVAGGAIGGGGKRMTFKDVNGVKEIEVVEGERTTRIEEDPAKSIKIKVTEKKDGKDETKEYEAKNAEELKEKHPEAHKLYEEYAKGAGGIRIEGLRIEAAPAFGGGEIRRLVPPAIIRDPRAVIERLDKAHKQLAEAADKLKKLADDAENGDEIRAALEAIEASQKELDEVKAQFPMR